MEVKNSLAVVFPAEDGQLFPGFLVLANHSPTMT